MNGEQSAEVAMKDCKPIPRAFAEPICPVLAAGKLPAGHEPLAGRCWPQLAGTLASPRFSIRVSSVKIRG